MTETCELCGQSATTNFHRLIPHGDRFLTLKKMPPEEESVVRLCFPCHTKIHELFSIPDLAVDLNTIERLKDTPEIQRWLGIYPLSLVDVNNTFSGISKIFLPRGKL